VIARLFEGHNNAFKALLIDYKKNICDYLSNEKRAVFRLLKDGLKLPNKCPFGPASTPELILTVRKSVFNSRPYLSSQGFYQRENWRPGEQFLPPILPGGEKFMLQMGFEFSRTDVPLTNVIFKIDRKKGSSGLG